MQIKVQKNPNLEELRSLLVKAYDSLHPEDAARFSKEQNQSLDEWFSLKDMAGYSGSLLEARDESGKLQGVAYVGKENPLSWPDGKKVKLFLLAVLPESRGQGLGQILIRESEKIALDMGAKSIMIDTHVLMEADHKLYRDKMGYQTMGTLKFIMETETRYFSGRNY